MKIFISQPMNGKSEAEITYERANAIEEVRRLNDEEPIEVIASYFENYKPEGKRKALKFLSKSLEMLADADMIVMVPGWREARGCRIEYECARAYGIPRMHLANNIRNGEH